MHFIQYFFFSSLILALTLPNAGLSKEKMSDFLMRDPSNYPPSFFRPLEGIQVYIKQFNYAKEKIDRNLQRKSHPSQGPDYIDAFTQEIEISNRTIEAISKDINKISDEFSAEKERFSKYYRDMILGITAESREYKNIYKCLTDKGVERSKVNEMVFMTQKPNMTSERHADIYLSYLNRVRGICDASNGQLSTEKFTRERRKYNEETMEYFLTDATLANYRECSTKAYKEVYIPVDMPVRICDSLSQFIPQMQKILENIRNKRNAPTTDTNTNEKKETKRSIEQQQKEFKKSHEERREHLKEMSTYEQMLKIKKQFEDMGIEITPEMKKTIKTLEQTQ